MLWVWLCSIIIFLVTFSTNGSFEFMKLFQLAAHKIKLAVRNFVVIEGAFETSSEIAFFLVTARVQSFSCLVILCCIFLLNPVKSGEETPAIEATAPRGTLAEAPIPVTAVAIPAEESTAVTAPKPNAEAWAMV